MTWTRPQLCVIACKLYIHSKIDLQSSRRWPQNIRFKSMAQSKAQKLEISPGSKVENFQIRNSILSVNSIIILCKLA